MIEAKCERGSCSIMVEGTALDIVIEAAVILKGVLRSASNRDEGKQRLLEVFLEDTYKKLKKEDCTYVDVPLPKKGGKLDES